MDVVSNERVLTSLKWTWSQMNVVSNERVAKQQVSNKRDLKWSGLNWLHTPENMCLVYLKQIASEEMLGIIVFSAALELKSKQKGFWKHCHLRNAGKSIFRVSQLISSTRATHIVTTIVPHHYFSDLLLWGKRAVQAVLLHKDKNTFCRVSEAC